MRRLERQGKATQHNTTQLAQSSHISKNNWLPRVGGTETHNTHSLIKHLTLLMDGLKCRTLCAMSSCHCGQTLLGGMTNGNSTSTQATYTYAWLNTHAHFPEENGRLYVWLSTEECWISANEQFQRKTHKFFDLRCPLGM